MDVLLKKYFWVINLLTVVVCAALAGRAASHLLEQFFFLGDDAPQGAAAPRLSLPFMADKVHSKDTDKIIDRNIFCSACAPPPPPKEADADSGKVDPTPIRTTLSIDLVSTMNSVGHKETGQPEDKQQTYYCQKHADPVKVQAFNFGI